jgi:hypothetical protein
MKMELTGTRLGELLSYDPETGVFTWHVGCAKAKKGSPAGFKTKAGYIELNIDGGRYYAHRVAWLWMTGKWPRAHVDHVNGDRSDNRFANLREASVSQNLANAKTPSHNTSGLKGAHWDARTERWIAQIHKDGKNIWLGRHKTKEAAHAAYCDAAGRLFGEFARAA